MTTRACGFCIWRETRSREARGASADGFSSSPKTGIRNPSCLADIRMMMDDDPRRARFLCSPREAEVDLILMSRPRRRESASANRKAAPRLSSYEGWPGACSTVPVSTCLSQLLGAPGPPTVKG